MAIAIGVFGAIALIGAGVFLLGPTLFPNHFGRATQAQWQAERAAGRSRRQVDDLFNQACIRMEEATGWRQPGERRIGDDIRGSWRGW
jgi:hypothetical protein